jgi:hypothetical protein
MGLVDVLNGMQNGPRGQRTPAPGSSGGGMSPMTMALLGLLAYKAIKTFAGGQPNAAPTKPGASRAARRLRRRVVPRAARLADSVICSRAA